MKKAIAFLLILFVLLAGCASTTPPEVPDNAPDRNGTDTNIFDTLSGVGRLVKGNKPIRINLDQNTITLGFEFDLNAPDLDLNILSEACNVTCTIDDANKWSLKKDLNFGVFSCYCTYTTCRDEESPAQITRYCSDNKKGFTFTASEE